MLPAEQQRSAAILLDEPKTAVLHLQCPRDRGTLAGAGASLVCNLCGTTYPVIGGVPVLINDASSVFAISDYLDGGGYEGPSYGHDWERAGPVRRRVRRVLRRIADTPSNIKHFSNSDAIAEVRKIKASPRVLVIGSGGVRYGDNGDEVIHTDVAFAPHVQVIADAHDLPFPDQDFDLVIAVAVLEHVADPQRCVGEFWRVLKGDGCVFAATRSLQPVHMEGVRLHVVHAARTSKTFPFLRRASLGRGDGGRKHVRLGTFRRPGIDLRTARLAALCASGRAIAAGAALQVRSVAGRSRALGRGIRFLLLRPQARGTHS